MATILCIDDDPTNLKIEEALFGSKGHTGLSAADGPTGVVLTRQRRPSEAGRSFIMH